MMTFRTGKSKTLLRTVIEWSEMLKVYVFSRTNELEAESLGSWKVLGDGLRLLRFITNKNTAYRQPRPLNMAQNAVLHLNSDFLFLLLQDAKV